MKSFTTALCFLVVVCSAFGAPGLENENALQDTATRDADMLIKTRELIEQLAANLRKSAQEALNAVGQFNAGLKEEANQIREKLIQDMQKFKNRVTEAVENMMNKVSNTSVAVKECVDSHRNAIAAVFNNTTSSTMACVDQRIHEISEEIKQYMNMSHNAMISASNALADMHKCTVDNKNMLAVGSCLGTVVIQTQIKSMGFFGQSALAMSHISIGIATLPSALKICAGTRVLQAGVATGKIIVEIGSCSATGIFNTIMGRPHAL